MELETSNGIRSSRIDWKLLEDMITLLLTFASFIFLIAQYIVFIVAEEWVFGLNTAKGTFVVIIFYTSISVLRRFYDSVKDASEKRLKYREVKERNKEE